MRAASGTRMLLERAAPGDLERAKALVAGALPLFERQGRMRWVRECAALGA